jgi:hypothetical protein
MKQANKFVRMNSALGSGRGFEFDGFDDRRWRRSSPVLDKLLDATNTRLHIPGAECAQDKTAPSHADMCVYVCLQILEMHARAITQSACMPVRTYLGKYIWMDRICTSR